MKETTITEKDIGDVITSIYDSSQRELLDKTEVELEEYWFFLYDKNASLEANLYNFYDMLDLYKSFCRRWEVAKGGTCCVVERVRDKYLMPKIEQLAKDIQEAA